MKASKTKRPGRRTKGAEERQADILAAAAALFAEKGIAGTSIEAITERAGIAKGALYLHFGSKDHVVAKLWERYLEGFASIVGEQLEHVADDIDWSKFIADLLERLIHHALDHAELHRTIYRTADAKALDLCRDMNRKTMSLVAVAIKRGVKAGAFQCRNPELTTSLIYHGTDGLLHDAILGDSAIPRAELVRTVQEFAGRTLGANAL